jgi:hypothetical protein
VLAAVNTGRQGQPGTPVKLWEASFNVRRHGHSRRREYAWLGLNFQVVFENFLHGVRQIIADPT